MSGLSFEDDVPAEARGLRLCKMVGDDLRLSECVIFKDGRPAVMTTLNRARISGHVGGGIDRDANWWADILDQEGTHLSEIRLDRASWNALKSRWMRCRMDG